MLTTMKRVRPAWAWGISAATVLLVVAAIVVTMMVMQQARDQRFLEVLRADETTTVGDLPDEQLLVSRKLDCEDIARGRTVEDALEAAHTNWTALAGTSEITEQEYYANTRALFNAAAVAC